MVSLIFEPEINFYSIWHYLFFSSPGKPGGGGVDAGGYPFLIISNWGHSWSSRMWFWVFPFYIHLQSVLIKHSIYNWGLTDHLLLMEYSSNNIEQL